MGTWGRVGTGNGTDGLSLETGGSAGGPGGVGTCQGCGWRGLGTNTYMSGPWVSLPGTEGAERGVPRVGPKDTDERPSVSSRGPSSPSVGSCSSGTRSRRTCVGTSPVDRSSNTCGGRCPSSGRPTPPGFSSRARGASTGAGGTSVADTVSGTGRGPGSGDHRGAVCGPVRSRRVSFSVSTTNDTWTVDGSTAGRYSSGPSSTGLNPTTVGDFSNGCPRTTGGVSDRARGAGGATGRAGVPSGRHSVGDGDSDVG